MKLSEEKFRTEIAKEIMKKLNIKNINQVPRLEKIVINMGVRNAVADKANVDRAEEVLSRISGQKPKRTKAKKSIASFKVREGDTIGLMVTLRRKRMYDFFSKLVNAVMPRIRDFHGVDRDNFDGRGNYTLGFPENTVFPEIDPGKVQTTQGLEINIVTTARGDEEGYVLLSSLGMPFKKD